jgi:hypothetical protein
MTRSRNLTYFIVDFGLSLGKFVNRMNNNLKSDENISLPSVTQQYSKCHPKSKKVGFYFLLIKDV